MKKRDAIILLSVTVILVAGVSFFVDLAMQSQQESERLVTAFHRVKKGLELDPSIRIVDDSGNVSDANTLYCQMYTMSDEETPDWVWRLPSRLSQRLSSSYEKHDTIVVIALYPTTEQLIQLEATANELKDDKDIKITCGRYGPPTPR